MLRTRTRKILRDIVAHKTRTLLVALSVFVGVLGVVAFTTLGELITRQLERNLRPSEMAMLRLFVNATSAVRDPPDVALDALRDYPGLTVVEGQAVYNFRWRLPDEVEYRTGQLYSYTEPYGQIELEPLRLRAGRFPREGEGEVAIEQRMAQRFGLDLGDTIVADRGGFTTDKLRVVGLVFQPYLYVGGGDGSASVFATYADAQRLLRFRGLTSIYARFENYTTARQESHAFRRAVMDRTPYRIVFYTTNDPQKNVFLVGVRQFSRTLTALSVLAMLVASVLVTTIVGMMMSEQRAQIGAMKALGASRADLLYIYLGTAFVYGLIGTIPGVLLGVPLGKYAAQAGAPVANTILEDVSTPFGAVALGLTLGLGVPVMAALAPVLNGTQISILDAITDPGIRATYGHGLFAGLIARIPLPMALHQALNNLARHKSRNALIIGTLVMAIAAFMAVFTVFRILNGVAGNIQSTLNYEVSVDPSQINLQDLMQSLLMEEQVREIQRGVAVQLEAVVETDNGNGQAQDELAADVTEEPQHVTLYVTGIDTPGDQQYFQLVAGDAWTNDPNRAGIVITQSMADRFEKTVGDTLRLVSPEQEADFEIIGVADFPLETAFMNWEKLAAFVGDFRDAPVPNAYWERLSVEVQDGGDAPGQLEVWALGVDDNIGRLLMRGFSAEQQGAIVSRTLAAEANLKPGDILRVHPAGETPLLGDLVEGETTDLPVLDVVRVRAQDLRVFASRLPKGVLDQSEPLLMALPWETLAQVVHLDYSKLTPNMFYIDLTDPEASRSQFTGLYTAPTPTYQNQASFQDTVTQAMLGLGLLMSVAASLMAIVGGIGLATITFISVFERQREIGVMRSVGATSQRILAQFLLEGLVIGAAAWAVGVPVSYLLSAILIRLVPFSEVISFNYTLLAPLIGLVGMLLVTGVATLYPALTAARKTVSDILRYQ